MLIQIAVENATADPSFWPRTAVSTLLNKAWTLRDQTMAFTPVRAASSQPGTRLPFPSLHNRLRQLPTLSSRRCFNMKPRLRTSSLRTHSADSLCSKASYSGDGTCAYPGQWVCCHVRAASEASATVAQRNAEQLERSSCGCLGLSASTPYKEGHCISLVLWRRVGTSSQGGLKDVRRDGCVGGQLYSTEAAALLIPWQKDETICPEIMAFCAKAAAQLATRARRDRVE